MIKRILFTGLVCFLLTSVSAQDNQLTIDQAVIGQFRELYPENLVNTQWQGNKASVYQDYYNIYQKQLSSSKEIELITLQQLNNSLKSEQKDTLSIIPKIRFYSSDLFYFSKNNTYYFYSIKENIFSSIIELPEEAQYIEFNNNYNSLAYTIENNIFIVDANGEHKQITFENNSNIVNGEYVSRREFGITKGLFWSPNNSKLAFYRKDNSKVKDYPLIDITTREAEVVNTKYPMAGMNSEHISLGVFDIETGKTIYIEANDTISEKYLTNISWDLNEENIYIQVLNRQQNEMHLNQYSSVSGELVNTLLSESHDKYVEPQHKLIFLNKNKNPEFIYQSSKDGFNHAYLYNSKGELINQITKGNWTITKLHGTDGKYIYYTATKESAIERHVYRTSIKNGQTIRLSKESGTHKAVFNSNYTAFIDNFSSTEVPRKITINKSNGDLISLLKESTNPLSDFNWPEMSIGTIKSADGETDLFYRLIKPTNFDSTKSYPVVVYVYGGPHAQLVKNQWLGGARMWQYYMAQRDYVMFTIDNRGSGNRGLEFENVIHRQVGVNEMKDQLKGIEFLNNLPYVDTNRIGVHGWSYGGFMTTSLMVNYPDVFKVGCAGGPVIDWKYYEIMYGERYMDTPEENPEGYGYTSLVPRAKDLKGKLLMIHGEIDPTVVMQNSQVFVRECIKNNVQIDYFTYPRAEHNVRGYDRIHLMQKVSNYFDDYLK